MDIDKFFQSKVFKGFILGLLSFLLLTFVFKVGEVVGIKKANFSCRWSDNYHQNFGGPKQGFAPGLGDKDFMEANGVVGNIMDTATSTITIKGRGDVEKIVSITQNTTIKRLKETIFLTDLRVNEMVVVIGEGNNQGQIEAKLIRVMPEPPIGGVMPKRILR